MSLFEDFKSWTKRNGAPVTIGLVISFIVTSLIFWFTHLKGMDSIWLTNAPMSQPWTFLTYPWAYMPLADGLSLMFFVFLMIWIFQVGGSVEREMGTLRYIILWIVAILLPAIFLIIGARLLNRPIAITAPYLAESAVTVVWCTRNRTSVTMLFGFLPMNGVWLGWATAITLALLYGFGSPAIGAIACLHLAVAYFFAADKISFLQYSEGGGRYSGRKIKINEKEATTRGQVRYDQTYFDDVRRRERERQDQERLKKLFGEDDK